VKVTLAPLAIVLATGILWSGHADAQVRVRGAVRVAARRARRDFTRKNPQPAADFEDSAVWSQFQKLDKCRVGQAIERHEPFLLGFVCAVDVL